MEKIQCQMFEMKWISLLYQGGVKKKSLTALVFVKYMIQWAFSGSRAVRILIIHTYNFINIRCIGAHLCT